MVISGIVKQQPTSMIARGIYTEDDKFKKFLQEKAVEATKQEKEKKEGKT
jgi:hypothetical protein